MNNELEKLQQNIKCHFPDDKIEFVDDIDEGQSIKVNNQFITHLTEELIKDIRSHFKVDLDNEVERLVVAEINNFLQS